MIGGTLARYFGTRFLTVVFGIFIGLWALVAMVDFIEMLRRTSSRDVSAWFVAEVTFYRVPYLTERIMPFAVMVGAMLCYLSLSRRLELVVARSAGISAWQFIAPAVILALLIGVASTTLYNPISAELRERSARLEAEMFQRNIGLQNFGSSGFWVRQRSDDDQSIINARRSSQQGIELTRVVAMRFDHQDQFLERIDARRAVLHEGHWRLEDARIYANGVPPKDQLVYELKTNLTQAQVRESFATPDAVSFWDLSDHIRLAESAGLAAAGYRLQYYQLLAQPFYLAAMVLLAASVSLGTARFGGVQKMVLGGMIVGFLLYVLSKVTGDLSKAGLMPPAVAAGLPPFVGGLTGLIALLFQEDG